MTDNARNQPATFDTVHATLVEDHYLEPKHAESLCRQYEITGIDPTATAATVATHIMTMAYVVVEGVESVWSYHIAHAATPSRSLCGRATMPTSLPIERWECTPPNYHIPETWCGPCRDLMRKATTRD